MYDRNHRRPRAHVFCSFAVAATSTAFLTLTMAAAQAQTGALTALATFNGMGNGSNSRAGLIMDSSGNLYGTTSKGGANNDGPVFEIAAGTSAITTLATFNGAGNGQNPLAGLTLDSSGNLYGTTELGGANNDGTVFKLSPSGAASAPEPVALHLLLLLAPVIVLFNYSYPCLSSAASRFGDTRLEFEKPGTTLWRAADRAMGRKPCNIPTSGAPA